jgi:glutamine synthetase
MLQNESRSDLTKVFGCNVFNNKIMSERLPKDTHKALQLTIKKGEPLKPEVADVVANAMKDWAIEKGATHYTHWFHPLTGSTAEKHDSFINPTSDGAVIMEFSGKQLIQGEPDASSFPNGGLRNTFEARGYTAWDATSPAFLKEDSAGNTVLCIPTAFCSYTSEALDKKTPLLRSMAAINKQATRFLRILGNTTSSSVTASVGAEQEYFLVDKKLFEKRPDLITCGRTLFGAPSPKGQEMDDHYFGAIKDRVSAYMKDLDVELWKMGITAKTKHNEVAPAQFELAPIFASTNIATDHNQLIMETMQKVALRHDLVCLLHEKPYAGINGSGKHNNWSIASDDGINFLDHGETPHDNLQFLLTIAAIIKGVNRHSDILRATAANAGNDHRLGANEAPPAIISIFMGKELTDVLNAIAKGEKVTAKDKDFIKVGVDTLPPLPKDNTDRNRTSPLAYTGNKFEFRMVPSSASIAGPCIALNTIMAEALDEISTKLEKSNDISATATEIITDAMNNYGNIIFNGNNYSNEWVKEAEKRGLPNITSTIEALTKMITDKAVNLFEKYNVLSREELESRFEIYSEQYSLQINIEAHTAIYMVNKLYIPAAISYTKVLADSINAVKQAGVKNTSVQEDLLKNVSTLLEKSYDGVNKLSDQRKNAESLKDAGKQAEAYRNKVFTAMQTLRESIDSLETIIPKSLWPTPSYADLLFMV